jgi:predicted O-methyltransferase YrrM
LKKITENTYFCEPYLKYRHNGMFFFRISRYLKYLLFSRHRNGHGIHSPFVFDLISRIFRNKINPGIVSMVEGIRVKNISDKRIINVLDLGAGSDMMKSNSRKVSQIARYSAVPAKYGVLLSNLAAEFGKPVIIEFGTSFGISTMYLALADPSNHVCTLEGCRETTEIAAENFRAAGIGNVRLMNGAFDDLLPVLENEGIRPGLVFIDGNHRKEPLLRYFSRMAGMSSERTVIIIDDIHYSSEMEEAWKEIKKYDNVSVTIDLFRMGLVFFRKGMSHFDYVVRY